MPSPLRASRLRYLEYRRHLKQRRASRNGSANGDATIHGPSHDGKNDFRKRKPRSRSFLKLLREFWKMLRGHHGQLILVLLAVSISSLLSLIPYYGPKIVIDSVLRQPPLPPHLPQCIHLPHTPLHLLLAVAAAMVLLACTSEVISLWSRWQTTRMTKRVQVSVR